jgi:hypothetical protein
MALPFNIEELIHGNTISSYASSETVFETDDQTYENVTLTNLFKALIYPISNQAGNQVKCITIRILEKIISFCNQAGNQAGNQAREVVEQQVHERVGEIFLLANNYVNRLQKQLSPETKWSCE